MALSFRVFLIHGDMWVRTDIDRPSRIQALSLWLIANCLLKQWWEKPKGHGTRLFLVITQDDEMCSAKCLGIISLSKKKKFHSFHYHFITFLHVIEALGLDYINLYSVRQDWVLINIWEVVSNRHLKMGVGRNVLMNNVLIEWSMNVGGIQHYLESKCHPVTLLLTFLQGHPHLLE